MVVLGILEQPYSESGCAVRTGLVGGGPPDEAGDIEPPALVVAERERHQVALTRNFRRSDEQPAFRHVSNRATTLERPGLELSENRGPNTSFCHGECIGRCVRPNVTTDTPAKQFRRDRSGAPRCEREQRGARLRPAMS